MMSVASKTKTKMFTAVVLGFLAALSVGATWANTTPGITSFTTVSPVVSTQSNQDLSELRIRLKDRFSGVATEVRSLITTNTSPTDASDGSGVRTIDVSQGIGVSPAKGAGKPAMYRQDFFVDIENDTYKTYINRLAAYGVLSPSQKFYPQNYFRVDDFISLLNKLYKKTTGQSIISQEVLGVTSSDGFMTKGMLQNIMYLLTNIEKVTIDGNPYDTLIRSQGAYYLVRMFDLPILEVIDEQFEIVPNMFTDITNHPFASAITTLASLGIVNTQTIKFYPDNYLRHYDFVVLFVNSFLTAKNQSLSSITSSVFADVDTTASYLPQLAYAADHGMIDYLITSRQGQLYFVPNEFMTKAEVYQILAKTLNIQFVYNDQQAEAEKITRAELATLLVDSFDLQPQVLSESDLFSGATADEMSLVTRLRTLLSIL